MHYPVSRSISTEKDGLPFKRFNTFVSSPPRKKSRIECRQANACSAMRLEKKVVKQSAGRSIKFFNRNFKSPFCFVFFALFLIRSPSQSSRHELNGCKLDCLQYSSYLAHNTHWSGHLLSNSFPHSRVKICSSTTDVNHNCLF